jgi:hypothetical protein
MYSFDTLAKVTVIFCAPSAWNERRRTPASRESEALGLDEERSAGRDPAGAAVSTGVGVAALLRAAADEHEGCKKKCDPEYLFHMQISCCLPAI